MATRTPAQVAIDTGQDEGTVYLRWDRALKGIVGLRGCRETPGSLELLLTCGFCESGFTVPHGLDDKQTLSALWHEGELTAQCPDCQAKELGR